MLTNKITGFSADLLNTVSGILGEAKKCPSDCECPKCEAEDDEKEMKEGSMPTADEPTDANKKTADKVRAMMAKEKKPMKEEILEMVEEASSGLADKAKKSGVSLSTLKKVYARGIAAWNSGHRPGTTPQQWAHARVNSYITKGKGTYHGADKDLRSEGADMPFEGPYRKAGEERKDEYGNKVKNVAKHLAKKAMKANEDLEHTNCGTPECCGQCDTPEQIDETAKIVAHLQKRYGDNIRKSHVRSAASDFGVDASKLAKAVRTKLGKNMLDEEDAGWYTHSQMHGSKKSEKHPKGISAAEWKSGIRWHHGKNKRINIKEEVEQIDEDKNLHWMDNEDKGSEAKKRTPVEHKARYKKLVKDAEQFEKHSAIHSYAKNRAQAYKNYHNVNEEVEELDEISKATMGRYINKAKDSIDMASYRQGHKEAHGSSSKPLEKKLTKRHKGISTAVSKLTKEEQDFVDALNNEIFEKADPYDIAGMIKKAKAKNDPNHPAMKHVAAIEDMKKTGGALSVQGDHVRSLIKALGEDANVGQIDEISKGAALKYLAANKKDDTKAKEAGDYDRMTKRMRGTDMAVRKYTAKPGSKYVRVPATEEVEITEARGRPRKGVAKDFTIHPRTKEKLMHNNPEHMKKIEVLQKNKVLPKPKVEADEHIMNQLQKAKTSMLGGSKINFTHGDSKHVSGQHAAKILTKYAGMKPDEKETFQKFVGHSHKNLMKHV